MKLLKNMFFYEWDFIQCAFAFHQNGINLEVFISPSLVHIL